MVTVGYVVTRQTPEVNASNL